MLYPKNSRPLTDEDFKFPASEYRAAPFWAWNTKLDKDELLRQIGIFKEMGYGGFHMHVRTGMATEYLSDEFMGIAGACVEKARREKMLAWLYDEDRWPSGTAGGIVTKNMDYRIRHLLLTRRPYGTPPPPGGERWSRASFGRTENGDLLACFDVILDEDGNLISYNMITEKDTPRGFKIYAYTETAASNPWYNNQSYADILNPKAVREFIRVTHERYAQRFQKDFGGIIPAIFTDEPQFFHGCLHYPQEDSDVTLPWTGDLAETYGKAYGEDLIAGLPELLWNLPDGKASAIRYHFHDHVTERFVSAFFDQCGKWCADHNILFTGHMMDEPTLEGQARAVGEVMRSYRSFQIPGIDMLGDERQFTTAKQAQSAARQNGCPGVLSELYGVTNWDFDFRGHKLQGDWQAALGVSVRVPHLSWASMNGEAKRDYPGTFNYQAPWYREYPYVEDHFARLAAALTRGRAICRVAVIHPVESCWLHWGPGENAEALRAVMDEKFLALCDWLLRGLLDFDYICESTLPPLCDISKIGRQFPAGKMRYDAVIVPGMETIRSSTMERLEKFRDQGGKLIFLGSPPVYTDAVPGERPQKLWERGEHIAFDRLAVLNSLEEFRELRIRASSGALSRGFLYQLREDTAGSPANGPPVRWLFICHADREADKDNPQCGDYRIEIRGEWQATEYNTVNGATGIMETEISGGWTVLNARLWDHDSLLVKLVHGAPDQANPVTESKTAAVTDNAAHPPTRFNEPVPVTLHEPNVLLLDLAEFALDDGSWRSREEILRLDNILRGELGWPLRGDAAAQPWAEHDDWAPHSLRLRYTFESEIPIAGTELALENAAATKITLNGEAAGPVQGWYVDKCIEKVKLPGIKTGTNTLVLTLPYSKKTGAEACYLLGDFSVKVQGTRCALGTPVHSLAFGDITRQGLPFYGGSLTYHLEAGCGPSAGSETASITIKASSYRFMLLRAAVDGIDRGVIAYAPYRLTVSGLSPGRHRIDLTGFGCRINTFGQIHHNQGRDGFWWGPDSWRTTGPAWSYEYNFWVQGVLKSPEIY